VSTHAVDNGASFAGLYGLTNPIVTWLIARGQGELVALRPEELHQAAVAPRCPGSHPGRHPDMLWRGHEWVCYDHDKPVRQHIPPRLQEIPPPPFSTFDVIGKEVSLEYTLEANERRASWHWLVDGKAWRP